MQTLDQTIRVLNSGIVIGLSFGTLLVITYLRYDKDAFFTSFGDIFIKFSFVKRDKRDLLVFATIPYAIGFFALIGRIMLM